MNRLLIVLTILSSCSIAFADDGRKFVSMFDGSTLKGWSVYPEKASAAWSVQDGIIVGEGDKGRSYLVYEKAKEVGDLELKFSYRFPQKKGNSGVNLRAARDETGRRGFKAYHVDIGHVGIGRNVLGAWDFHTPGRKEHGVFRGDHLVIDKDDKPTVTKLKNAVTLDDIRKGDWNEVHVIMKGNRYWFSINGKPSAEFVEHLPAEKRLHKGMIQFQLHDPGMIVQFRDLKLKVLD